MIVESALNVTEGKKKEKGKFLAADSKISSPGKEKKRFHSIWLWCDHTRNTKFTPGYLISI